MWVPIHILLCTSIKENLHFTLYIIFDNRELSASGNSFWKTLSCFTMTVPTCTNSQIKWFSETGVEELIQQLSEESEPQIWACLITPPQYLASKSPCGWIVANPCRQVPKSCTKPYLKREQIMAHGLKGDVQQSHLGVTFTCPYTFGHVLNRLFDKYCVTAFWWLYRPVKSWQLLPS